MKKARMPIGTKEKHPFYTDQQSYAELDPIFQALEGKDLAGARYQSEAPVLKASAIQFGSVLKGISKEDILQTKPVADENSLIRLLRHIMLHTKLRWEQMGARGHDVEMDSVDRLLDLMMRPSAHTVVLRAVRPGEESDVSRSYLDLVGYSLVITDLKDFPDTDDIPESLLQIPGVCRGLRVFLDHRGTYLGPRGEGLNRIFEKVIECTGGNPIITKILVAPKDLAYRWSKIALELRGFEGTGFYSEQQVTLRSGEDVQLSFEWFLYPPRTETGQKRVLAARKKYENLEKWVQPRIAHSAAYFSTSGSRIAHVSRNEASDVFDFAELFPRNFIIGLQLESGRTPEYRHNAVSLAEDSDGGMLPENSLDGILNSHVLPTVLSHGENIKNSVEQFLEKQFHQLRSQGVLIIHDRAFSEPQKEILAEFRMDDGNTRASGLDHLSTAELFKKYLSQKNIPLHDLGPVQRGEKETSLYRRFRVSRGEAFQFSLIKDYRDPDSWGRESNYTFPFSQEDFIRVLGERGFRVLSCHSVWNEWIIGNRLKDYVRFFDTGEAPLPYPPSSFRIVGEKVSPDQGIRLEASGTIRKDRPDFLGMHYCRRKSDGLFREYISRPGRTIDTSCFFRFGSEIYLLAKRGYPRPLKSAYQPGDRIDGSLGSGYHTEQVAGIVEDQDALEDSVHRILKQRIGIDPSLVKSIGDPKVRMVAPGSIDEIIEAVRVEVHPSFETREVPENYSGFSTSGSVRPLEARQLIRAAQVGGASSVRLEIEAYELLLEFGFDPGPWIGEDICFEDQIGTLKNNAEPIENILNRKILEPLWEEVSVEKVFHPYFVLYEGTFQEINTEGKVLAENKLEYVEPSIESGLSNNIFSFLPVMKVNGEVFAGVEPRDDFPAVEKKLGRTELLTVPAFRLPRSVQNLDQGYEFAVQRMQDHFDIGVKRIWDPGYGSRYHPSPGVLRENWFPRIAEIDLQQGEGVRLQWYPLETLLSYRTSLQDIHLLLSLYRLSHALGYLDQ